MPRNRIANPQQRNLIINGGVENTPTFVATQTTGGRWIDGTFTGSTTNDTYKWWFIGAAGGYSAQFDSTVKHWNKSSIKVSATDVSGRSRVNYGQLDGGVASTPAIAQRYGIPIVAGHSITLNAYCKTNNVAASSAFIDIGYWDSLGNVVAGNPATNKLSGTVDWTLLTTTFTVPVGAAYIGLRCMNNVAGNVSDAWFSDIVLIDNNYITGTGVVNNGNLVQPVSFVAEQTQANFIDGTAAGSATQRQFGDVYFDKIGVTNETASIITDPTSQSISGKSFRFKLQGLVSTQVAVGAMFNGAKSISGIDQVGKCPGVGGHTYRISVKMKIENLVGTINNLGMYARVGCLDAYGVQLGSMSSTTTALKVNSGWVSLSVDAVATAGTVWLNPAIRLLTNAGDTVSGDFYFTDFSVIDLQAPPRNRVPTVQNLYKYSNALNTKTPNDVTFTLDSTVMNPFGVMASLKMQEFVDASPLQHFVADSTAYPDIQPGDRFNASVFIRPNTRSKVMFAPFNAAGQYHAYYFDLINKTSVQFTGTSLAMNPVIEDYPNGFKRISLDCVAPSDLSTFYLRNYVWEALSMSNPASDVVYQADGTGIINLMGFQVTKGWGPKPYVETGATAVNTGNLRNRVPTAQNLITYSNTFTNSVWTKRGSLVVTPNAIANPVDGTLDAWKFEALTVAGGNDLYRPTPIALGTYCPSIWIKRISTIGTLLVVNRANPNLGTMSVNMASLPDAWVEIYPGQAGVAVNYPFAPTELFTWQFYASGGPIDFYAYNAQVNSGSLPCGNTVTGDTAVNTGNLRNRVLSLANYALNSENGVTGHTKFSIQDVTNAATIAPDGTLTAYKITEDSSNGRHFNFQSIGSVPIPSQICCSAFLKAGERRYANIRVDIDASIYIGVTFDLLTGVVTSTTQSVIKPQFGYGIAPAANGFFRCWVTDLNVASTNVNLVIGPSNSATPTYTTAVPDYQGDGVSGIYAWGEQLNRGSVPADYIKTTSAAITAGTTAPRNRV